jgi:hypothetical protein
VARASWGKRKEDQRGGYQQSANGTRAAEVEEGAAASLDGEGSFLVVEDDKYHRIQIDLKWIDFSGRIWPDQLVDHVNICKLDQRIVQLINSSTNIFSEFPSDAFCYVLLSEPSEKKSVDLHPRPLQHSWKHEDSPNLGNRPYELHLDALERHNSRMLAAMPWEGACYLCIDVLECEAGSVTDFTGLCNGFLFPSSGSQS